jgi:quinol monooxygenase YgiN
MLMGRDFMLRLLALAGLAITALGPSLAQAQNATLYSVTYIEVGPVLAKVGALALRNYCDAARKDTGAVRVEVLQRIDRPNQFAVLGAWSNPMAFEAHASGEQAKKLNEKLATTLASPNDIRQHTALSVAPAKPAKDPIVVVTHVDVPPAQKDAGADALKKLADDSRKHAGNVQFDVWEQTGRPNHFTIVEVWANRGAFDLHEMQKETRAFRATLAPMLGALYDERIYKELK